MRKTIALLFAVVSISAMADDDLALAQEIVSCVPAMMHGAAIAKENGLADMAQGMEDSARGAVVAAGQSLKMVVIEAIT